MADITLSIPNDQVARVVNALCALGGYDGNAADQPARREFARQHLAADLRQKVLQYERREAASEAMASVVVAPITVD